MTLQDDIQNFVTQSWQDPLHSPLAQVLSYSYALFYVMGIIIAIFVIVRGIRRYSLYAGNGRPHGAFTVGLEMNGDGYAHGNLSSNSWFNEDSFKKIKKQDKEYNINFDEFKRMLEAGEVYIYDFKITDHSKTWSFKEERDVVIVANGKMESDDFSVPDKKGRFSLTSATLKEFPRNVTASVFSRTYSIPDPWGKKRDVWYLSLLPMNPKRVMADTVTQARYEIVVNTTGNTESLAKSAILLPTLIKFQDELEIDKQELENYRQLLKKEQQRANTLNILLNKARHLLTEKIFVGFGRPPTPLGRISELAWIIGAFFGGAYSYGEIPKYFPSIPAPLMAIAVFIIIIALREIFRKKQEPIEDTMEREAQESLGA